ncbi:MAG: AraC family transcriptional regulator ligand-binding domain-containing protein [Oceanospirillaceae bacterium]|nr:AraC family transcriptional regulator ligand-binding domain-containing protein [Oceanospirillaceae bacterium]
MPNTSDSTPSFNLKLTHALLQLVQHQGVSIATALSQSNIKQALIDIPGQRYPTEEFAALLSYLISHTDNPKLAIAAAEATQPRTLGSLGFIMTTANTLQDAYQMLGDYFSLIYEGISLEITYHQQECILNLEFSDNNPHVIEFFIACLLNWPRWLTGRAIPAQCINFNFNGDANLPHYRQLATQVNFSQSQNQLIINSQYMSLACQEGNPEMHQLHCDYADSLQLKSSHKQAIIAQTKHQIRLLIQQPSTTGTIAIRREQVAEKLNMSLRTFQRKLSALDTSFQQIHDTVRRETCIQLISQPQLNFGQIAYKLGFSNLSAFQKAFKRWMDISPSQYRNNLIPQDISTTVTTPKPINQFWHSTLTNEELNRAIANKFSSLSHFTQQLLALCALSQQISHQALSIETLASISGNTVARLSIYLWPAQQQQLIDSIDQRDSSLISIQFTPLEAIPEISNTLNPLQRTELHFSIARHYQSQSKHLLAIKHYLLCAIEKLEHSQLATLYHYCKHILNMGSKINEASLLNSLFTLTISCKITLDDDTQALNDLYLAQLDNWIKLSFFDAAHLQIGKLNNIELTNNQKVDLAVIATRLLIEMNQNEQAQVLLLKTAQQNCQIDSLDSPQSQILLNIANELEQTSALTKNDSKNILKPESNQKLTDLEKNKRRILQSLINTYLHAQQPIKAAGAIAYMFKLCLNQVDDYYAAFASAHFSWVCCWFSGDINTAKICAQRAIALATRHSLLHRQVCDMILQHKFYHWIRPLGTTYSADNNLSPPPPPTTNSKASINPYSLPHYLDLCSGTSLSHIVKRCQNELDKAPAVSLRHPHKHIKYVLTCSQDLMTGAITQASNPPQLEYIDSHNAFCQLFSHFYNFDVKQWGNIQHWDARIESEMISEYLVTEAFFICTLMRLHALEQTSSDDKLMLERPRFQSQISRLEFWSQLCPENFKAQFQIAYGAYLLIFFGTQTAARHFESIYSDIENSAHPQHKILYYHYYAKVLRTQSSALYALCEEKKQRLIKQWSNPESTTD